MTDVQVVQALVPADGGGLLSEVPFWAARRESLDRDQDVWVPDNSPGGYAHVSGGQIQALHARLVAGEQEIKSAYIEALQEREQQQAAYRAAGCRWTSWFWGELSRMGAEPLAEAVSIPHIGSLYLVVR